MRSRYLYFGLIVATLASTLVCFGCAHTRIPPHPLQVEAVRVAGLNQRTLRYHVDCEIDEIVGHQYLLIAFPFGRISLENPSKHLAHAIFRELAIAGFRPREAGISEADLIVRCDDLSLTAYDFLFFRRIIAALDLTITRKEGPNAGDSHIFSHSAANKAFAFFRQLDHVWDDALTEAAQSVSSYHSLR